MGVGGGEAEISKEVIGRSQRKGVWYTLKTRMMDFGVLGVRAILILPPWGIRVFIKLVAMAGDREEFAGGELVLEKA